MKHFFAARDIPGLTKKAAAFLRSDIWRMRTKTLPKKKTIWVKPLRVFSLAINKYKKDLCPLRASALTFFSLLSIVPVLAMAFGIAKGFGFEKTLETQLLAKLQGQQEVISRIMDFANRLLENTQGGLIAGAGIVVLLWTIMRLLGNIENSFNHIWEIKTPRRLTRKVSDYLSAVIVCPVLLIIASTVTVVVISQVKLIVEKLSFLGVLGSGILFVLKFLPYAVIWGLFTFIYLFMPNKKIKFASGAVAGIIAGTLYQLFQWAYLSFQFGVSRFNAIYGSFAALPLFLLWLQISWMIVLFGAEVSYAHQNAQTFELEPDYSSLSHRLKLFLTLRVAHLLIKNFSRGDPPLPSYQIADTLELPVRLVNEILSDLVAAGIISVTCNQQAEEQAYQPAQDSDVFTIAYVLEALESTGAKTSPDRSSLERDPLFKCLGTFQEAIEKSPANMKLKDI